MGGSQHFTGKWPPGEQARKSLMLAMGMMGIKRKRKGPIQTSVWHLGVSSVYLQSAVQARHPYPETANC